MRCTPSGAAWRIGCDGVALVERDAVRDGVVDAGEVGAVPHCADDRGAPPRCKLSRHRADAAEHAVDEDRRAFDRPVAEDGAMGGDAGNAQTRAHLVADVVGERDRLVGGHHGELRGGAEGPVGLGAVDPDALSGPGRVDAVADRVDDARPVAVRDHPRIRHPVADPVAALLRVPGVDARDSDADANLARSRLGVGHLADLQHLRRRARPLVPSCEHPPHARPPLRHPAGRSRFEA